MVESTITSKQTYSEPVSSLLELGDGSKATEWPDYRALGLTEQDVPELSRMMLDQDLFWADSDSNEVWAPIHAWRALAQLEAASAIPALIELLGRVDEYDDDWTSEELPVVFAHLGQAAIEPLRVFLADSSQGKWSRTTAGTALAKIGERHPDLRVACLVALSQQLENFEQEDSTFNALLIGDLIELKGVEAAPVMEQAFAANKVDLLLQGDWEQVQIYLGLLDKRKTPPPDNRALMAAQMGIDPVELLDRIRQKIRADPEFQARAQLKAERKAAAQVKAKTKAKRKQAKQNRKQQRKRK